MSRSNGATKPVRQGLGNMVQKMIDEGVKEGDLVELTLKVNTRYVGMYEISTGELPNQCYGLTDVWDGRKLEPSPGFPVVGYVKNLRPEYGWCYIGMGGNGSATNMVQLCVHDEVIFSYQNLSRLQEESKRPTHTEVYTEQDWQRGKKQ